MRIEIHGARNDRIRDHVNVRMAGALDSYEERIERVDVRLADLNGNKGGIDKEVLVNVHMRRSASVIVHERDEDMYAAVATAAGRAKTAVGRVVEKKQRRHHVGWRGEWGAGGMVGEA